MNQIDHDGAEGDQGQPRQTTPIPQRGPVRRTIDPSPPSEVGRPYVERRTPGTSTPLFTKGSDEITITPGLDRGNNHEGRPNHNSRLEGKLGDDGRQRSNPQPFVGAGGRR